MKINNCSQNTVICVFTHEKTNYHFVSLYLNPNECINQELQNVTNLIAEHNSNKLMIGSDSNAKSKLWSPTIDARGYIMEEFIFQHNLFVLNEITIPIFQSTIGESFIDITLCSDSLNRYIFNWSVEEKESMNDHNYITFDLNIKIEINSNDGNNEALYCTKKANWDLFDLVLEKTFNLLKSDLHAIASCDDLEKFVQEFSVSLKNFCDSSIPLKKNFQKSNPWWTKQLSDMRKIVNKYRKVYQKEKFTELKLLKKAEYYRHKKEYEKLIFDSKSKSWQNFCTSSSAWDLPYKFITSKIKVNEPLNTL